MQMTAWLMLALGAFFGGTLQSIAGFGGGVMLMIVLPNYFGIVESAAMTSVICLSITCMLAVKFRKHLEIRGCILPTACFLVCSVIAIELVGYIDVEALTLVFGFFLILLCAYYFCLGKRHPHRIGGLGAVVFSSLSGVCSGLFSVGGPLMSTYFLSVSDSKESYIANSQFLFLVSNVANLAARISKGIYTPELILYSAVGIAFINLGLLLGLRIFDRLNSERVKQAAYILVGISGVLKVIECL